MPVRPSRQGEEDRPDLVEHPHQRTDEPRSEETEAERIARRAYERYQARGGEHGRDQEDWFEAEQDVRGGRGE